MEKDMTVGKPTKMIINFTIPIFIGNVFQQFYSMADTIIVGKFVGNNALAAVGSVGTIMFLILGFLMGLTMGFTVMTAQRFGAMDMRGMRKTVGSACVLSMFISVIMTVLSMAFMKKMLIFMNTPKDIFTDAYTYIMIICAGIFVSTAYNLFSSILRAVGNSKVPLYFLILSAVLNIFLDLVLIIGFNMGVPGAAYATVISQGISAVLCLGYIIKKVSILRLEKDDLKLSQSLVRSQMSVGLPMAFQYSITAIGTMLVQSSLNLLGSGAVAAFTAANKIENILTQAYVALGTTMTSYCAQNRGAGKYIRIRSGFKAATLIGITYSMFASGFFWTVGKYMSYLFVSEDISAIMVQVEAYLRCIAVFMIPLMIVNTYRNGIQGMGYGLLPMTAGIAELFGRGTVAVVAAQHESYFGVCMASPIAWVLAAVLLLSMYFYIVRSNEKFLS